MKDAMRAKDKPRLDAIRFLQAAIKRREIDERIELNEIQVVAVIEKLIKQSRDAAAQFVKGGRPELADKENESIKLWEAYLPAALPAAEISALIIAVIQETGAEGPKDMGKVMAALKPKLQGRADMGQVSAQVKAKLSA